jgi:hypothetical protein
MSARGTITSKTVGAPLTRDLLARILRSPSSPAIARTKMNLTSPASRSLRVIGCLMLLVYVSALPGIAPFALAGLAAAGDHDHEVQFTTDGEHMSLVLHHHEADEHTSDTHDHDKETVPHTDMLAADAGHGHDDHVIHLGSSSASHVSAFAKPDTFPAPSLAPPWEAAHFAPGWPRELKYAPLWGRAPPGDTAHLTCLRTTVLIV